MYKTIREYVDNKDLQNLYLPYVTADFDMQITSIRIQMNNEFATISCKISKSMIKSITIDREFEVEIEVGTNFVINLLRVNSENDTVDVDNKTTITNFDAVRYEEYRMFGEQIVIITIIR